MFVIVRTTHEQCAACCVPSFCSEERPSCYFHPGSHCTDLIFGSSAGQMDMVFAKQAPGVLGYLVWGSGKTLKQHPPLSVKALFMPARELYERLLLFDIVIVNILIIIIISHRIVISVTPRSSVSHHCHWTTKTKLGWGAGVRCAFTETLPAK